jgi:hypothetical protein
MNAKEILCEIFSEVWLKSMAQPNCQIWLYGSANDDMSPEYSLMR